MAIGVALALAIVLLVGVVGVILLCVYWSRKRSRKTGERKSMHVHMVDAKQFTVVLASL